MAKGISPLGQGLLGFATGALESVETDFREQRTFDRERTLEDYRLEKQKELARLKNEFDLNVETVKAGAKVEAQDKLFSQQTGIQEQKDIASLERTKIMAASGAAGRKTATEAGKARKQATEAAGRELFNSLSRAEGWDPGETDRNRKLANAAGGLHMVLQSKADINADRRKLLQDQFDDLMIDYDNLEEDRADRDSYTIPEFSIEGAAAVAAPASAGLLDEQAPVGGGGMQAAIPVLVQMIENATSQEEIDQAIAQFEAIFGAGSAEGISTQARGQ
jgi:hypothetical protein